MSTHGLNRMYARLEELGDAVSSDLFREMFPDRAVSFLSGSRRLMERIESFTGTFLTVGLIGGTGVGKSTLMNALAGAVISSIDHRRPHTDDIIIYRHEDAPIPAALPLAGIPWREFLHDASVIEQVLLCDLPDFDSVVGVHHSRVVDFLQYLDILIWVLSPEKYGDGRFYEFLRSVPKARNNFYFVLNKADLFFSGVTIERVGKELETVKNRLETYLAEIGSGDRPLYILSAKELTDGGTASSWNQFPVLKEEIFRVRAAKDIETIKTSNIEKEVDTLLSTLHEPVGSMMRFIAAIDRVATRLKEEREAWNGAFREEAHRLYGSFGRPKVIKEYSDDMSLIGPGRLAAGLLDLLSSRRKEAAETIPDDAYRKIDEGLTVFTRRQMKRFSDRLTTELFHGGAIRTLAERIETISAGQGSGEPGPDVPVMELPGVRRRVKGGFNLFFTGAQYIVYIALFFILILSLGDRETLRNLIDTPGGRSIADFFITVFYTLFSSRGIAAIGTYLILNLFFGFRFHAWSRRYCEKKAAAAGREFEEAAARMWEERLVEGLAKFRLIRDELEALCRKITGNTSVIPTDK